MEALLKGLAGAALIAGTLFVSCVLGTLFGAFAGWCVSIAAPGWVTGGMFALGLNIHPDQLVSVGAALGFVGGFFRSSVKGAAA